MGSRERTCIIFPSKEKVGREINFHKIIPKTFIFYVYLESRSLTINLCYVARSFSNPTVINRIRIYSEANLSEAHK